MVLRRVCSSFAFPSRSLSLYILLVSPSARIVHQNTGARRISPCENWTSDESILAFISIISASEDPFVYPKYPGGVMISRKDSIDERSKSRVRTSEMVEWDRRGFSTPVKKLYPWRDRLVLFRRTCARKLLRGRNRLYLLQKWHMVNTGRLTYISCIEVEREWFWCRPKLTLCIHAGTLFNERFTNITQVILSLFVKAVATVIVEKEILVNGPSQCSAAFAGFVDACRYCIYDELGSRTCTPSTDNNKARPRPARLNKLRKWQWTIF